MSERGGGNDEAERLPFAALDLEGAGCPAWAVDPATRRIVVANAAALDLWSASTLQELSATPMPEVVGGVPLATLVSTGGVLVKVEPRLHDAEALRPVDCLVVPVRVPQGRLLVFEALGLRGEFITLFDGATGALIARNTLAGHAHRRDETHYLDHFADGPTGERLWRAVASIGVAGLDDGLKWRSATAASLEVRFAERNIWCEINLRAVRHLGGLSVVLEERLATRRSRPALPSAPRSRGLEPVTGGEDSLTGLGGPARLVEWLSSIVDEGALVLIEIIDFATLAADRGEAVGVQVLRATAARLGETVRPSDLVVRLGGGRFAAVLPGFADAAALDRRIGEIVRRLSQPVQVEGADLPINVRVGLALWPHDGTSADALERVAAAGIGRAEATPSVRRRLHGEASKTELQNALDSGQFEAFFQPIIGLDGGRVIGCEALARWNRPARGLVTADQFIPPIEAAGLMWTFGDVILRQALRQIRDWQDRGLATGRIAVNIGTRQLINGGLAPYIANCLEEVGLSPMQLAVEVTEAIALGPHGRLVIERLNELHDLGVEIVLDDFGTGHAALALLQRLPVNRLKIDRPLIAGIGIIPSCEPIIRMVTDLAHSLSLQVVAEGVETREQLHFLRLCGCDAVQGNLFAPAMAPADATMWLTKHADEVAALEAAMALAGPDFPDRVTGRTTLN